MKRLSKSLFRRRALQGCALGIALVLSSADAGLVYATPQAAPPPPAEGRWSKVPAKARFGHAATLLRDGRVLVTGGCLELDANRACRIPTADSELYDPEAKIWIAAPRMAVVRAGHMAMALPDGRVLVAGGCSDYNAFICRGPAKSAELFNPTKATWTKAAQPVANISPLAFGDHSATMLPRSGGCGSRCGHVLVVGVDADQLYDPAADKWSLAGPRLSREHIFVHHTATGLPDGRVLVLASPGRLLTEGAREPRPHYVESIYDAAKARWAAATPDLVSRDHKTATRLDTGRVLVVGGLGADGEQVHSSAELWDPDARDPDNPEAIGAFAPAGSLTTARFAHSATLLGGGKVLVMGGSDRPGGRLASSEIYDPATGAWAPAGDMASPRGGHIAGEKGVITPGPAAFTATRLLDGRVLVVGGSEEASAELYTPARWVRPQRSVPRADDEDNGSAPGAAVAIAATAAMLGVALLVGLRKRRRRAAR